MLSSAYRFLLLILLAGSAQAEFDPSFEYGSWRIDPRGRFMFDYLLDSSAPLEDRQDFNVRRARLELRASYGKHWKMKGSVNFPEGDARLHELSLGYTGLPVHLEVGRIQEPFGMTDSDSSNYLPLMERPLASGIGGNYSLGLRANVRGKRWAFTVGAFAPLTEQMELADPDDDEALDARFTWTPLRHDLAFVHVGVAMSWRRPEGDSMRISLRPETTLVDDLDINHPRLGDVPEYRIAGLEFAWRAGPVLLQSEYYRADLARTSQPEAVLDGYYAQLAWAVTGEQRGYSTRRGVFGGLTPHRALVDGGIGTLELALRYSEADLRDAGIAGDRGDVFTAGINWYPTGNLRTSVNYSRIAERELDRSNHEDVWQARLQFHF